MAAPSKLIIADIASEFLTFAWQWAIIGWIINLIIICQNVMKANCGNWREKLCYELFI